MKVVIIGLICIVWVQKASSAPKWTCSTPPGPSDDDSDSITDNGLMVVNHHDDGHGTTYLSNDTDFFGNGTYSKPPTDPFKIVDNDGPGYFNPAIAPTNNFRPPTDSFKIVDNDGPGEFNPAIAPTSNFRPPTDSFKIVDNDGSGEFNPAIAPRKNFRPSTDSFKIVDNDGPGDFNIGIAPRNNFRPSTDSFKIVDNGGPSDFDPGNDFRPRSESDFRKPSPDPGKSLDFNNHCHTLIDYDREFGASPDLQWNIWLKFVLQLLFFSGMTMNLCLIWKKLAKNPPSRGFNWNTMLKIAPAKLTGHRPIATDEVEKAMKNLEGMLTHLLKEDKFKFSISATSSTVFELSVSSSAPENMSSPSFLKPDDIEKNEELQVYLEKCDDQKPNDSESKFSSVLTTDPDPRFSLEPWPPVSKTTDTTAKASTGKSTTGPAPSPTTVKVANTHCFVETPEFPLVPWHLVEAKQTSSSVEPAWTLAPTPARIPDVLPKFEPKWDLPVKKEGHQTPFDDEQHLKSDLRNFVEIYKDWTPKWTGPNTTEKKGGAIDDVPATCKSDLLECVVKYKNWTPTWTGGPIKKEEKVVDDVPTWKSDFPETVVKYKNWTPTLTSGPSKKEQKLVEEIDDLPTWKSDLRGFGKKYKERTPIWTGPNVGTTEDPNKPPVEVPSWKSDMREFVDKYKGWTPVWIGPDARKKDQKPLDDEAPAWKSELRKLVEKYKGLSSDWNGPKAIEGSEKLRKPRLPKKKVSFAEDVTVQRPVFRRMYPFVPKILCKKMKMKIVSETVPLKGDAVEKPFKDIKLTNKIICLLLF